MTDYCFCESPLKKTVMDSGGLYSSCACMNCGKMVQLWKEELDVNINKYMFNGVLTLTEIKEVKPIVPYLEPNAFDLLFELGNCECVFPMYSTIYLSPHPSGGLPNPFCEGCKKMFSLESLKVSGYYEYMEKYTMYSSSHVPPTGMMDNSWNVFYSSRRKQWEEENNKGK